MTQSALAAELGVSQSQVSRALSGNAVRPSRVFKAVCEYANWRAKSSARRGDLPNDELVQAVREVWDGTSEHAAALASVIRSLALLQKPPHPPRRLSNRPAKPDAPKGQR